MHALVALLGVAPALGWSSLGHRVAAQVAQDRLSPEAKAGVGRLFGEDDALAAVAACPDELLFSSVTFRCGRSLELGPDAERRTAPWHYVNLPASMTATAEALSGWCPGGDCLLDAIRAQQAVLARADATDRERRLAVMHLVHLVADAHQPLHCANDDDRGGNDKRVALGGESFKLHELWDGMLRPLRGRRRPRSPNPMARKAERLIRRTDVSAWLAGDPVLAAVIESHEIAGREIYPAYQASAEIDAAYLARFEPVVVERLAKAGVRLAAILERALAGR